MKPAPKGWPRISASIYYREASKMIDWLCEAFGFAVLIKVEGEAGRIEHSELTFGESLIMVSSEKTGEKYGIEQRSPLSLNGITQGLLVFVDDVDAHCAHARAGGAKITAEPAIHDYGEEYWTDRSYAALDPEGHLWWFTTRVRDQKE